MGSCVGPAVIGGRLGEGQAEDAVEREGEESSSAWHASEQYIGLLEGRNEMRQRDHVKRVQGQIFTCRHAWACRIEDSSLRQTWSGTVGEGRWRETRGGREEERRALNERMTTAPPRKPINDF